jgi:V8-like Glu-specific endopeptidase
VSIGEISSAIACIRLADGSCGTGFSVDIDSKRYLFTNNHVIADHPTATTAKIWFNYQSKKGYKPPDVQLDLSFFWTDVEMDVTVILLKGALHLIEAFEVDRDLKIEQSEYDSDEQVITKGGLMEAWGHPNGEPLTKTADGYVLHITDVYRMFYNTSTQRGNSGSPVLLMGTKTLVCIHHTGYEDCNEGTLITCVLDAVEVSQCT